MWSDFHFLRPWWLLGLLGLLFMVRSKKSMLTPWSKVIAPHLLPYLFKDKLHQARFPWLTLICMTLIILALSGPTYKKIPTAITLGKPPLILILQLNNHMLVNDIEPSRLKRAVYKITDLFKAYNGEFGLIVYAGDAHVLSPITKDTNTIKNLLASVSPEIMPKAGNDPLAAITLANEMSIKAKVILLAADLADIDMTKLSKASKHDFYWWIFSSNVEKPKVGIPFTADMTDINFIVSAFSHDIINDYVSDAFYDTWFDLGPYILLIAMLFFILSLLWPHLAYLVLVICLYPKDIRAEWFDLFLSKDQQAKRALNKQDYHKAADLFQDPMSKGLSYYLDHKYEDAIKHLSRNNSAEGYYNLGNAYVKNKQYQEAINAYDEALKLDNNHEDAKHNKKLVEDFLAKQKKDNDNKQDQEHKDNQENKENKPQEDTKDSKHEDQKGHQEQGSNQKPEEKKSSAKPNEPSPPKDSAKNAQERNQAADIKEEAKSLMAKPDQASKYKLDQVEPSVKENNAYLRRKFYVESMKKNQDKQ